MKVVASYCPHMRVAKSFRATSRSPLWFTHLRDKHLSRRTIIWSALLSAHRWSIIWFNQVAKWSTWRLSRSKRAP